jgi:hypothetical protein
VRGRAGRLPRRGRRDAQAAVARRRRGRGRRGCVAGPYYDGAAAGTCAVKGGDVLVSGGQGTRIAVAVKLDKAISCDVYKPGHTDMRTTDGAVHDGVFDDAYFNGDVLTE